MSLPPINPGTLITVRLTNGELGYAQTFGPVENDWISVRWLYSAQDLVDAGYGVPVGYPADTYWRTNHEDDIPVTAITNINPCVRVAAVILPFT
jgi:hypothetical protein